MKQKVLWAICICIFLIPMSAAAGEVGENMGIKGFLKKYVVDQFVEHLENFMEKHVVSLDHEARDYAEAFLTAAQAKDTASMKALFAPNAVAELGEEQLDQMLEAFVDYFQGTSFEIEEPLGPNASEYRDHGKKQKELEGPLEIITNVDSYRMCVRCFAYDDWEPGNIGIWSIYIIERAKDKSEKEYRGDLKYRTGIYFDVERPNR